MAVAANALAECGGGLSGGQRVLYCRVALPVAGLMNDERTAEEMSWEEAELGQGLGSHRLPYGFSLHDHGLCCPAGGCLPGCFRPTEGWWTAAPFGFVPR